jgi:hypothetical protein
MTVFSSKLLVGSHAFSLSPRSFTMSLRSLALLSFCVLLVACSKVNQENYSKISTGMPKADVEKLLGTPSDCSGALGMSSCTWGNKNSFISVQYAGDKVLMFSGQGLK